MSADPPPRMTEEQRRAFVHGLCNGTVWTDRDCSSAAEARMVFLPLSFMSRDDLPPLESVGVVWADITLDTHQGALNGIPIFFACRFMHAEDWNACRVAALDELERRSAVAVPASPAVPLEPEPAALAAWETDGGAP